MTSQISLTVAQRKELNNLWFIYGNKGKKHTHGNHRFIQNILERGKDERQLYVYDVRAKEKNVYNIYGALTKECIDEVDKILKHS